MTRNAIVLSSLLLLAGSVPAFAQDGTASGTTSTNSSSSSSTDQSDILQRSTPSRAPAVFVTGGYGLGMNQSSHLVSPQTGGALQTNLSGRTSAGSFGVGTFLTPRLTVRFEMIMPSTLTAVSTTAGAPIVESLSVAQTTRTGAVLFGYSTSPSRLVSVEYLGGVLFMSQKQVSTSALMTVTGVMLEAPTESDAYAYRSAAIAGMDVRVALGRHLAVVPGIRAWSMNGTLSTQTSVGFRVNF